MPVSRFPFELFVLKVIVDHSPGLVKQNLEEVIKGCLTLRQGGKVSVVTLLDDNAAKAFHEKGWCRFSADPVLANWVRRSLPDARRAAAARENARWLRCDNTWFVGVNTLPNDSEGAIDKGPALAGAAVEFVRSFPGLSEISWDRAQISICYPGYPGRMDTETETAHRYRIKRDAAHVDGLLAEGADRRRRLREHHAFILGVPMTRTDPGASPFVVWEGSVEIVRAWLHDAFAGVDPESWCHIDITDSYHAARRKVFERCRRIEIYAEPGEAYLVHRLALHGIAPWRSSNKGYPEGRMVCYFRPDARDPQRWLINS